MQIREATEQDIPAIIEVLKASLGEISSKKNEEVWRYKHIHNPFGKSLVLIAVEQEKIIGVRAFMCWKWQKGNQVFSTYRAVDTATHPDHQGKGVFKRLTLEALKIAREKGDDFIFNTPNSESFPGYLKMGWEKASKINVQVIPVNPFSQLKQKKKATNASSGFFNPKLNLLIQKENIIKKNSEKLFTPKSLSYLKWRYEQNLLQSYEIISTPEYYLVFYIKDHRFFRELRIVEISHIDKSSLVYLKKAILKRAKEEKVQIVSNAGNIKLFLFTLSGNFGPMLTLKNINSSPDLFTSLLDLSNWTYCLGDLELF